MSFISALGGTSLLLMYWIIPILIFWRPTPYENDLTNERFLISFFFYLTGLLLMLCSDC
jgi:hypothetical protein